MLIAYLFIFGRITFLQINKFYIILMPIHKAFTGSTTKSMDKEFSFTHKDSTITATSVGIKIAK